MRNILLILAIFAVTTSIVYSAPNYDPNHVCTTYDCSENLALRKKLENAFDKKYIIKQTSEGTTYSYPEDAYYREVLQPYYRQKKPMEELPKTYSKQ